MNEHPSIFEALASVMADVRKVAKSDFNDHQRFSFRGVDAVVNAVGPALRDHGVIVVPRVLSADYEKVTTTNNKPSTACRAVVEYVFFGPAGDAISTTVIGEAWDSGDKAAPKAMSVAFRTALLQALALPTDEPDPDSQVYERAHDDQPHDDPPIVKARLAVKAAWEAQGVDFDPDAVANAYEQWKALPFGDATPEELHEFAAYLTQTDDGAADVADSPQDPAPSSPLITAKQVTALSVAMTDMGLRDRDQCLDWLEKNVGRRVESRKELTRAEAKVALDKALFAARAAGGGDR